MWTVCTGGKCETYPSVQLNAVPGVGLSALQCLYMY